MLAKILKEKEKGGFIFWAYIGRYSKTKTWCERFEWVVYGRRKAHGPRDDDTLH